MLGMYAVLLAMTSSPFVMSTIPMRDHPIRQS